MSRAYLLDDTLKVVGLIDQSYTTITYTRHLWDADTAQMVINRKRLYASGITLGRMLYLPDEGDRLFLIEQVDTTQTGERAKDEVIVGCRSLEGIAMAERLCLPPVGDAYDNLSSTPAETAMKHYVDVNAVSATNTDRNIPNLQIVASSGRGLNVDTSARYQTVLEFVAQIGVLAGLGWEITYDRATGKFVFDVIDGTDRSASVFFDFAFETLEEWEDLQSALDSKSVAVVAGQGEGLDRDIVVRGSGVGFDRREAFIDARDVNLGDTAVLEARGDAFLAQATIQRSVQAKLHQFGSFKYRTHWDLGDIVLLRNTERGIDESARIIQVDVTIQESPAAPTVVATLGKPFPTLQSQTDSGAAGTADYPDTLNPKVDSIVFSRAAADVKIARTGVEELTISDGASGDLSGRLVIKGHTRVERGDAASGAFNAWVTGDTVERIQVLAGGKIQWGPGGAGAIDTNLYRGEANVLQSDDAFRVERGNVASGAFLSRVLGDTVADRLAIFPNGEIQWGDGASTRDVVLFRSAANELTLSDKLIATLGFKAGAGAVFASERTSAASSAFTATQVGDVAGNERLSIAANGSISWGDGTNPRDTIISRGAANRVDVGTGDSLNLVSGTLMVAATSVVGTRKTGWGAPTGTATRTTFATDTVTLIELARRVKALVDDLTTHGLVGA